MVAGWAERTPPGFTMHVKAFGLMTRHPVKVEVLPEDLRAEMPVDERGRVDRPPREIRGEVFRRFLEALRPLRDAGKLGGILFQLPSYVVFKESSLEYLEWARAQLGADEMLVELRHRSWLDDENRAETLAFLERIGATYVDGRRAALRVGEEPRPDRAGGDVAHRVRPLPRAQPRHVEQAGRLGRGAVRLPLLGRGARRVGRAAAGARRARGAGVRLLQQQRDGARIRENPLGRVSQAATNARQLRRLLDVNRIPAAGASGPVAA